VPVAYGNSQCTAKFSEVIGFEPGYQFFAQFNGTKCGEFKFVTQSSEFCSQDPVVKTRIVCDENTVSGDFNDPFCDLVEFRSILQHFIVDAGKLNHKWLNFSFRIDQTDQGVNYLMAVVPVNGNFCNAFFIVFSSGGFYVNYYVNSFVFSGFNHCSF